MSFHPRRRPCDLARTPLDPAALEDALLRTRWRDVRVLPETASTNADLAEAARAGAPAGSVITTEHQAAGRGRLDRTFVMPPRSGIAVSALIRPTVPLARWSWLPLVAGLAVADLARDAGVDGAGIKWPNDVLVGGRKLCGILLERVESDDPALPAGAIIGMGLNVTLSEDERPVETATSLLLEGADELDRTTLTARLLAHLDHWLELWEDASEAAVERLQATFVERCTTVGQQVRIILPSGDIPEGTAETVDEAGRLVVDGVAYSAGDVTHVRPAG